MKKQRIVPDWAKPTVTGFLSDGNKFTAIAGVEINHQAVSVSYQRPGDCGAKYSDADLELIIARLKVAKEVITEDIDTKIRLFQEILAGG